MFGGLDASAIGVASVSAATTLAAVKVIAHLTKNNRSQPAATACKAQECLAGIVECQADTVGKRLQEYHTENRALLTDIRDGIREIVQRNRRRRDNDGMSGDR